MMCKNTKRCSSGDLISEHLRFVQLLMRTIYPYMVIQYIDSNMDIK